MNRDHRLWVQVTPDRPEGGREGLLVTVAAGLVSSGIGNLISSAADKLTTDAQFAVDATLAYEPAFRVDDAGKSLCLLKSVTVNVGPSPVKFKTTAEVVSIQEAEAGKDGNVIPGPYEKSPVVIRVNFEPSNDGTACAARVVTWKYENCLGDPAVFHSDDRKITVEIKVLDVSGSTLLSTAMQVSTHKTNVGKVKPQDGERLPWSRMPSMTPPANPPKEGYGPVNIVVKITEVASPSWLGRLLGATLSSQKAAVETYVKDRVTEAFDASAAAQSKLTLVTAAQAAWQQYSAAHKEAKAAREAYDKERNAENQAALVAKRAIVIEKEALAREAYAKAGLAFLPLAAIAAS